MSMRRLSVALVVQSQSTAAAQVMPFGQGFHMVKGKRGLVAVGEIERLFGALPLLYELCAILAALCIADGL